MTREQRRDPHLDTVVHIVADRQHRPNLPNTDCPFCVGGREAPEPYEVRAFPNRWPALNEGYCEVVLYTPEHDATFASLGAAGIRRVIDLWAERTVALRQLPDGEHVIVFENRGAEIGATISHPHGQIYAFDHVPQRPARQLRSRWTPEANSGDREILVRDGWKVWAEYASVHPVSLRIAPLSQYPDIPSLDNNQRDCFARVLADVFAALETLFDEPLPYMMWMNQSPRTTHDWPQAWLNCEIVSPWRATGVPRYIAAVEIASEEYFNPVDPAQVARRMREALPT
ncbi:MAG: galactose-phosphate uridylyltransferase [Actinomycetota bacterium]|jgi:UDPglucose--hexose-1-phosphate uridylyltransferase